MISRFTHGILGHRWSSIIFGLIIFATVIGCLLSNFGTLPGLHGDEAWFGLRGIEYYQGNDFHFHGMNKYTGSLQSIMASVSFKAFGVSVNSLRLPGIIFNIIALGLAWHYLTSIGTASTNLFFLLLISQSFFYLSYARIAWEVSSLTFILTVLYIVSIWKLSNEDNKGVFWLSLNLSISLIGSYNHIIFSSLPLAFLVGLSIDSILSEKKKNVLAIATAFVSLCIISLYFFLLNGFFTISFSSNAFTVASSFLILIIFPTYLLNNKRKWLLRQSEFKINEKAHQIMSVSICLIAATGLLVFLFLHGLAFIQILSGEVILRRVWAYQLNPSLGFYFLLFASLLSAYFIIQLISALMDEKGRTVAWVFVSYLCIFSIYTVQNHPRYYLIVILLFYLLLAITLEDIKPIYRRILLIAVVCNFFLTHTIFRAICNEDRKVKPLQVKIGYSKMSYATHFLPLHSVIDSLRNNKIGTIESSESFFIMQPIYFYKHIFPEFVNYRGKAYVEYDYHRLGTGFRIAIPEAKSIKKNND